MGYAIVFSGQGGQHPDMLPWLADDALTRKVNARLAVADWRASLQDADWAARNAPAQCLLTGVALAAWAQLAPHLPPPAAIAGYSVGELAAFSAAGVFDADTALDLAQARAIAMDRCAEQAPGGLLGVSQIAPATLARLLAGSPLAIAIRNAVDSVVLGGPHAALDAFETDAVRQGARCTRLRVSVPSHTPAMQPAAEAFAQVLGAVSVVRPRTVLFSNAADRVSSAEQARSALAAQIATTVRWDECMDNLHARGLDCVLEIGAGQALARLWNARDAEVPARSADEFRSAQAVVQWIHSRSSGRG
jgi:[acyl-carrier-protein] S-malonyltransferase